MAFSFAEISAEKFTKFVNAYAGPKSFLQSQHYGEFRQKIGETGFYYGIFDDKKLLGVALIQKTVTKLKTFLHCPHGPLLEEGNKKAWLFFLNHYQKLGRAQKADFVRVSSLLPADKKSADFFAMARYRSAPIHMMNPERTWTLDITRSEEDILADMRKSTRYEVRRIEKTGIKVTQGNSQKDLDTFWKLHLETVKRQGFNPFPKKNTEIELQVFGKNAQIFSAQVEGKFLSSSIILFDDDSAYYHQGASVYSKVPVAHATLWTAIKEAKKRGCTVFNFWGVVAEDQTKHPWYGLSKFKRGFGGIETEFLHCHDYPLTPKYWLSFLLEKYRRWRRNY